MRRLLIATSAAAMTLALGVGQVRAEDPPTAKPADPKITIEEILQARTGGSRPGESGPPSTKKYRDFAEVTKDAQKIEGLFTLYRKDDHLYAEIKPSQFDQPMLIPTTIARGVAQAGTPLGTEDEMVVTFHKVGDRVQLIRRNVHYKAPSGTPIEKSVKQNYTDSILMALPIQSINPSGQGTLIDLSDIFLTDFAQLGLGSLDRGRTNWYRVKAFPNNLELEVEATFMGGGRGGFGRGGTDSVIDRRGITVVIHYSLIKAPDSGYRPRAADDRVGYFLSATKDFGSDSPDTNFVRYVNRWRLEKADSKAKLSPPKKQIVWYIEDTVPFEYRPYVESAIREWNKAFEKIGYREAIAVRWQEPGRDDFDPEDTNYCTFRWITSDQTYAMSCLRANPMTGEMIDGDVIFDASWIRHWKQEHALLIGSKASADGKDVVAEPLAVGEIISPALAAKMGFGQPGGNGLAGLGALAQGGPDRVRLDVVPSSWSGLQWQMSQRLARGPQYSCQLQLGLHQDFAFAALALADPARPGSASDSLPDEFLGQAIKEVVMHEVGHSLGLRHNFKASAMLTADELNDTAITRSRGLVGSVMDYSPVNIAPKGKKQGDFYSTTLGPYDYWAIEYAYKPIDGSESEELKKIAARAPEADLSYGTDEDAALNHDPLVNRYDLGSDPCRFGQERIKLASELLKTLDSRAVKDGESWARTRQAFGTLLRSYGDGAHFASQFIGGQSVSRHHKGDKNGKDPIIPIPGDKQRECLKFLVDTILSDQAFQYAPALMRRLGVERWEHWGSEASRGGQVDYPLLERVLDVQRIVLGHCLNSGTLARLQNQELQSDAGSNPLRMEEVFRALSDGVWSDLTPRQDAQPATLALSSVRRNLQREYLRRLSTMVLGDSRGPSLSQIEGLLFLSIDGGGSLPADARALARLHLKQTGERIAKALETKDVKVDDTTRAHLEECHYRIGKTLDATLTSGGF